MNTYLLLLMMSVQLNLPGLLNTVVMLFLIMHYVLLCSFI